MKTTGFFAAALVLFTALSCQKENQQELNTPSEGQGTLITCSFAANDDASRTSLDADGLTPKWSAGDSILIYDPFDMENRTSTIVLVASGTPSSETGLISEDSLKFTFYKPSDWGKELYAIYPSIALDEVTTDSITYIHFSAQDGSFAKANICAGRTSSKVLSFKNAGAILKFTSKPLDVTKVGVPVSGLTNRFKLNFEGDSLSLVSDTPLTPYSNEISIGEGTGVVYIGVPAEEIPASSTFVYKKGSSTAGTYSTGAANNVEINKIYNLGPMMGALPGLFSVSATKKVQFSRGNLQATVNAAGTPSAFNFAENQSDIIGNATANTTIGTSAGNIDLFGWSTDATNNNWGIHTKTSSTTGYTDGNFKNWGKTTIVNGGNKEDFWSTLSNDEWKYLLNLTGNELVARTDSNRYAKAKVNGIKGLILFPDGYYNEATISGIAGIAQVNKPLASFPSESVATDTWNTMESKGCVFLPAAGFRNGSTVNSSASTGCYWTSTLNGETEAYRLYFGNGSQSIENNKRFYGNAVRLVHSK